MTERQFRALVKRACPQAYRPRMDLGPVRCWRKRRKRRNPRAK